MTDKPTPTVPGYEAGKEAAELFGRMTRLVVYGNGGGVTACLVMAAAMIQTETYTAWTVFPLALFWLGLVFAFWILAGLHATAVARVAEENVLLGTMMKRRYRIPIMGLELNFSDHVHLAGGQSAIALLSSALLFVVGSLMGFALLLFV